MQPQAVELTTDPLLFGKEEQRTQTFKFVMAIEESQIHVSVVWNLRGETQATQL